MLLQKILILLMLGLAVLFCAVGCDEAASVQAGKTRPVNNQPDKAVPLPAGDATQSTDLTTSKTPAVKTQNTPSTQPADRLQTPVAVRKPSAPPAPAAPEKQPAAPDAQTVAQNEHLTPKQVQFYDSLRQQSLKLQMKLDELQEKNEKLTRALIDSREAGRTVQDNLQRSMIVQEIQKREMLELKDRLGQVAVQSSDAKPAAGVAPVETDRATTQNDPVHLNLQIARLHRMNEKLQLQLQLAKLDTPDARQKVLVKLGEAVEQNEKLEKINRELSHMVVSQSDQVRELQKREEQLRHLQADHAEQIARMDRRSRKELATLEIQIAESRKLITNLKNDVAQRDYQIRTLNGQLADAKAAPSAPAAVAAVPEPENQPRAGVSRPVLIKVAPVETVPAAPASVIARNPAPQALPKPAPAVTPAAAPAQTVAATPAIRAARNESIAGKITAIEGLMVMVDVGKDFGLEEGMRLISYREDKFVGYLRVEQVGRRESACTFSRQILPPQVGDHVVDRLE